MYFEPTPEQRSTTLKSYNEDERMLRSFEVLSMLSLSRTSLWRFERANIVPPALTLGSLKFWRLSSILFFLDYMSATKIPTEE